MISEPFAAGTSFFHRMEPRIRIVCALIYSIAVAVCVSFPPVVFALLFSALMTGAARLNPGLLFRRIAVVNVFILFFWLVLPFTHDGDPLFHVAGLAVTRQGVAFAALLTIKSNAIILGMVALVATMSFVTMGHALGRLGLPDKLVNLLLMTYRYIFVIEVEYGRIIRAVKIRGFMPRTSLHAYKTYAYIVGMLFVKASERAERVYGAMQCRGFKGKFYTLSRLPFSRGSWAFAGVMGGIIVCIALLEIYGNG